MDRPLRIAHCVESYAPALGGMPEVVKQLSERMVRLGHSVTVYTSSHPDRSSSDLNGVHVREFDISGNAVSGMHGDQHAYREALRQGDHDVVVLFAAQQWATDSVLDHLASIPGRKVFVPTGFSALHAPRWADYFRRMPGWLAAMDLNIFLSENYQDVAFAKEHGITRNMLIPNGAAADEFEGPPLFDVRREQGIALDRALVLHIGTYTGIKGHREAIELFIRAETGDAVLMFVGNNNTYLRKVYRRHYSYYFLRWRARLKRKRILFLELDRARTVSALKQADLFLFPSNVECSPIVLFEACAAGVPFLSSGAGNSAEIAEWTQGGWIIPGRRDDDHRERPDIAAGARRLEALLADPDERREAGRKGRAAWRERFTWEHITKRYLHAYLSLLNSDE
ncbi:MAG: glycosyltransferase family 4 protein [Flavobacteriales bacterium]